MEKVESCATASSVVQGGESVATPAPCMTEGVGGERCPCAPLKGDTWVPRSRWSWVAVASAASAADWLCNPSMTDSMGGRPGVH